MNDWINGVFELGAGLFILLNCWRTYQDKEIKGYSVISLMFFTAWGYWNLYFYPSVDAWVSFWAGVLVVMANTLWLGMVIYYCSRRKAVRIEKELDWLRALVDDEPF